LAFPGDHPTLILDSLDSITMYNHV
jgi:hypothetical protein